MKGISAKASAMVGLAVILLGAASSFALVPPLNPGDVNGDGVLNQQDVALIIGHLLQRAPLSGDQLTRADANQDGEVNAADLVWTAKNESGLTITLPGDVPLRLVRVPMGSFQMGSPDAERGRGAAEGPDHSVSIAYDCYVGRTEVTQQQWMAVMAAWPGSLTPQPSAGVGDNYPVYYASWNDAQSFVTALNAHLAGSGQGGITVRLPSEAEWEYACRAGTPTRFFFGDSLTVGDECEDGPSGTLPGNRNDFMWYCGNNSVSGTKSVATRHPNGFSLYDMSGNVEEWCEDYYHASYDGAPSDGSAWVSPITPYRVMRGGYSSFYAWGCRSAQRSYAAPYYRDSSIGFRIVATVP